MKMSRLSAAGAAVAVVLAPSLGVAQTRLDGFALNTYDPADPGGDWFALESLDMHQPLVPTFGVIGDYAHNPLVFHQDDEEVAVPIESQLHVHLGAALAVSDRIGVGMSMPIALVHDGSTGNFGTLGYDTESGSSAGDLRFSAHWLAFGEHRGPLRGGLGLLLHFPTGRQEMYVSDGKTRAEPRVQIAGDVGALAYAGRVGVLYRARNEDYLGYPFGTQLTFGLAGGIRLLDDKMLVGPELYGSTMVSDGGDGFFKRRVTPVDLLIGGHYEASDAWRFRLGGGPGLTPGWGSPDYRVLASVEFSPDLSAAPPPAPLDRDGDGISDVDDACPDEPGVADADPSRHGCPAVGDQDGDGIPDPQDACPAVAGPANPDPAKNGCPGPGDRDGDGIPDPGDACPDQAGPADPDPAKNGCPATTDRDGDGVTDDRDACPDEAGSPDPDPSKNGCPQARIEGGKIEITERVEFETGEAVLTTESDSVLNAVANVLKQHPEIKKLGVQGHTDNRGTRAYNLRLSRQRAASVVDWLVRHGIEAGRLEASGLGPDKPIDSNETAEGRQNNRRVEFHIIERE